MTSAPNDVADLLDILAELSNQLASELDLHYDDETLDRLVVERNLLSRTATALSNAGRPLPDALFHVLEMRGAKKSH